MENKFKVGDKVKIIKDRESSVNIVGDVGIVTALSLDKCRVTVEGRENYSNWQPYYELELIEKSPEEKLRDAAGDLLAALKLFMNTECDPEWLSENNELLLKCKNAIKKAEQ